MRDIRSDQNHFSSGMIARAPRVNATPNRGGKRRMFKLLQFTTVQAVLPCVLSAAGGIVAAALIRWRHERDPFITLLNAPPASPIPPDPPPVLEAEFFDPRPDRFQLRWHPEVGTYGNDGRSREQNKMFRE